MIVRTLVIILLITVLGCGSKPNIEDVSYSVDGDNAYQLVKELVSIGPRPSGSENLSKTAEFIDQKCRQYGYQSKIDIWTEETPRGKLTFRNVYATLMGEGEGFVILGSHHDTKNLKNTPNFVGANDGGSSTALLLEIMRVLKKTKWHGKTIKFAFFDGEEAIESYSENDGLHGSKKLAQALKTSGTYKDCNAMILLDMVGDKDLTITLSPDDDSELIETLLTLSEKLNYRKYFGFFLHGTIIDDHIPFRKLGIPTLNIIDLNYGPNNYYWHTDLDTLDKLSSQSLQIIGNITLALLAEL